MIGTTATLTVKQQRYPVLCLHGHEGLNQSCFFQITLKIPPHTLFQHWEKQAACLQLQQAGTQQNWYLYITDLTAGPLLATNSLSLTLQLQTALYFRDTFVTPTVWSDKALPEIIYDLLKPNTFPHLHLSWPLRHKPNIAPYVMQPPGESNLSCFRRLLFENGFTYQIIANEPNHIHFYDTQKNYPKLCQQHIAYQPKQTVNFADPQSLYQIQIKQRLTANTVRVRDYKEQPWQADYRIANSSKQSMFCLEGDASSEKEAQRLSQIHTYAKQHDAWQLYGHSLGIGWRIGHIVTLDLDALHPSYSNNYLIVAIHYSLNQSNGQYCKGRLRFARLDWPFCHRTQAQPSLATTMTMQTRVYKNNSSLNVQGDYAVQCDFSKTTAPQNLPPIPRLHLMSNFKEKKAQGWHTPWLTNTVVIVAFRNGNPNRAIILGNLASHKRHHHAYFKTPSNLRVRMHKNNETQQLALSTHNNAQTIQLQNTPPCLQLHAHTGTLAWQSQGQLYALCHQNWEDYCQRYSLVSQQAYHISVQNNLFHQAQGLNFNTQKKLNLAGVQQIKVESGTVQFTASQSLKLNVSEGKGLILHSNNESVLESPLIHLTSTGHAPIELIQGQQRIKLYPDRIELTVNTLSLK